MGTVEPLRISYEEIRVRLERLKERGLIGPRNQRAARAFTAARLDQMGYDAFEIVGMAPTYGVEESTKKQG